jgi:hypothetical protein
MTLLILINKIVAPFSEAQTRALGIVSGLNFKLLYMKLVNNSIEEVIFES